jgi:hypothetical protein
VSTRKQPANPARGNLQGQFTLAAKSDRWLKMKVGADERTPDPVRSEARASR